MRPIDDRPNAPFLRDPADFRHREYLARDVDHMTKQYRPRLVGHPLLEELDDLLRRPDRHRQLDLLHHDAFAHLTLAYRVQHPPIVLRRRQDLVARLQADAVQRDLKALAGVSRDGHLFRVAAECPGKPHPHQFELRILLVPKVLGRRVVRPVELPLHRLVDQSRRGGYAPVVKVNQRSIEIECLLDMRPGAFVGSDRRWLLRGRCGLLRQRQVTPPRVIQTYIGRQSGARYGPEK